MGADQLKALLIQIREDFGIKKEELESFSKHSGLGKQQIHSFDVFQTPHFTDDITSNYDLVFIGGASDASVLEPERYPFVTSLIETLRGCAEKKIPTFASCFGFQAAILALGGNIIHQAEDFEMGTYPINIKKDESALFEGISNNFQAISVHKEKAIDVPENCTVLGRTENCIHIFQYKDHPFFGFQFHPELDRPTLVKRLQFYQKKYTADSAHFEMIIKSLSETPDSNKLLSNFIKNIVLKKAS